VKKCVFCEVLSRRRNLNRIYDCVFLYAIVYPAALTRGSGSSYACSAYVLVHWATELRVGMTSSDRQSDVARNSTLDFEKKAFEVGRRVFEACDAVPELERVQTRKLSNVEAADKPIRNPGNAVRTRVVISSRCKAMGIHLGLKL
jgi:hypothetical protein